MQITIKHLKSKVTEQLQNTLASQKNPSIYFASKMNANPE